MYLYLVGDVRHDLYRLAEVLPLALLKDHRLVHLPWPSPSPYVARHRQHCRHHHDNLTAIAPQRACPHATQTGGNKCFTHPEP